MMFKMCIRGKWMHAWLAWMPWESIFARRVVPMIVNSEQCCLFSGEWITLFSRFTLFLFQIRLWFSLVLWLWFEFMSIFQTRVISTHASLKTDGGILAATINSCKGRRTDHYTNTEQQPQLWPLNSHGSWLWNKKGPLAIITLENELLMKPSMEHQDYSLW